MTQHNKGYCQPALFRRILRCLVVVLCLPSFFINAQSASPHEISFHSDDPYLTNRVNKDAEPFSASVDTVQMLLNEISYTAPVLNVPLSRSFKALEQGESVCILNKRQSAERIQKYLFSLPLNFFQTQRLYQLAELPPISSSLLNNKGEISSIHHVLNAYPQSAIIRPENYSYGEYLDAELAQVNKAQIITIANHVFYSKFMNLLQAKKTDFALIYPISLYKTYGSIVPMAMRSYAIAGNPKLVSGHVICGNNEQGKKAIALINRAIKKLYYSPQFILAHTNYLQSQHHREIKEFIEQHIN